jgi:hypothetical protein
MKEAFDEWNDNRLRQANAKLIEAQKRADIEGAKAIKYATQKEQARFLNAIVTNQNDPQILESLRSQFEKDDL